jgi:hypothetical protein
LSGSQLVTLTGWRQARAPSATTHSGDGRWHARPAFSRRGTQRCLVSGNGYRYARPAGQHRIPISGSPALTISEGMTMIEGGLIAESLRVGTSLENLDLTVRKISRVQPLDVTPGEPEIWTVLDFVADEAGADELAHTFAATLDDQPVAWYADFRTPAETFVVFPGRIFRYPRGDRVGRAEAEAYGRQLGIAETQLDWPV